MIGKMTKVFFGIIGLCLLGPVIFPLFGDIIKVTWASLPWWVQTGAVAFGVIIVAGVIRVVLWTLTGRSTFHR